MKITIIVGGRFHAFDLAEQLNKKGFLLNLITSYPKWKISGKFNIEKKKIKTILFKEVIERIIIKLKLKYLDFLSFYLNKYFEYFASKKVDYKNSNIIIGWSGFSYKTFKKSKNYNIIKILERGSSHIEYQSEILTEEYKKFNIKYEISQKAITQELKEYDIADYISIPSKFVKNTFLQKRIDEKKLILIPYGVNLFNFFPKEKKDNIFRFIYVGTLSIRKGVWYTLKAFDDLNLPNAELIMVGLIDSDFLFILEEFKSNKNIKFIQHIEQNKLVNYYNISDVFVISSVEDGFAMVILQSLACGIPVICTENSGGSELILNGVNGYIVPIRDLNALKNKMTLLYENKKIYNILKTSILKQRKDLSWDNYGDKLVGKYNELLKTD